MKENTSISAGGVTSGLERTSTNSKLVFDAAESPGIARVNSIARSREEKTGASNESPIDTTMGFGRDTIRFGRWSSVIVPGAGTGVAHSWVQSSPMTVISP